MNDAKNPGQPVTTASAAPPPGSPTPQQFIVVPRAESAFTRLWNWLLRLVLVASIALNVFVLVAYQDYFTETHSTVEKYHAGDKDAEDKVALIHVTGTIMPPYTKRILKSIDLARDDDKVKAVVLVVDSPGGLVSDSHEIYHRLKELGAKKPIAVSMKTLAASGGYYVSMGAGKEGHIFAEPTTWTGSIGVIIPRYEIAELAKKVGVDSKPLKTGPFKDALNPFRELSPEETAIWTHILNETFERFISVIADNRKPLDHQKVKELATGQIYTADDAKKNGLIDEIGFEEDAIADVKKTAGLDKARVVSYESTPGLMDLLVGSAESRSPASQARALIDASVPRAMYFYSWGSVLPPLWQTAYPSLLGTDSRLFR